MTLKDIAVIVGIILNLILIIGVLVKISFGQGIKKTREEQHSDDIKHIKNKLDNHIEHLQLDWIKLLGIVGSQAERIAKIEGKMNGQKKD